MPLGRSCTLYLWDRFRGHADSSLTTLSGRLVPWGGSSSPEVGPSSSDVSVTTIVTWRRSAGGFVRTAHSVLKPFESKLDCAQKICIVIIICCGHAEPENNTYNTKVDWFYKTSEPVYVFVYTLKPTYKPNVS